LGTLKSNGFTIDRYREWSRALYAWENAEGSGVPIPVLATIWIDAMKDGECNYLENRAYAGKEPDKGAAALRNY
jgi:hypothetical protein